MGPTLRIDDDVLEAAEKIAREMGLTVGEVISELARRGLASASEEAVEQAMPVFSVNSKAQTITADTVRRALEES